MQHASTSPFYPLFASLDVGAQMMKGRSGEVLWDDTIRLGIELRKKMRAVRREFEETRERAGAALVLRALRARSTSRSRRAAGPSDTVAWERCRPTSSPPTRATGSSRPARAGTASPHVAPGFAMTDPNKLTLLTPGFDRQTGRYADHGIPAPVVAQYLRENRIVPRRTTSIRCCSC